MKDRQTEGEGEGETETDVCVCVCVAQKAADLLTQKLQVLGL